jgi:hypothetical protein
MSNIMDTNDINNSITECEIRDECEVSNNDNHTDDEHVESSVIEKQTNDNVVDNDDVDNDTADNESKSDCDCSDSESNCSDDSDCSDSESDTFNNVIKSELEKLASLDRYTFYNTIVKSKNCTLHDYIDLLDNNLYKNDELTTLRETIQNTNAFRINRVGGLLYIKFKVRHEDNWCEVYSDSSDDTDDAIVSRVEAEILHYLISKNNRRNVAVTNQIDTDITPSEFVKNAPMPKLKPTSKRNHNKGVIDDIEISDVPNDKKESTTHNEHERDEHEREIVSNRHSRSHSMMTNLSGFSDLSDMKTRSTLGYIYNGESHGEKQSSVEYESSHMFECIRNKTRTAIKEMMNTKIEDINDSLKKINTLHLHIPSQHPIQRNAFSTVNLFNAIKINVAKFNDILNVYNTINVIPYKRILKKVMYELCYLDETKITDVDLYFLADLATCEIIFTKKNEINMIGLWNSLIDVDYIIDDID